MHVTNGIMDATLDVVMNGAGSAPLSRVLEIASIITRAPVTAIAMRDAASFRVLVSRGLTSARRDVLFGGKAARDMIFAGANIYTAAQLAHVPRAPGLLPWAWAASVPIAVPTFPDRVALVCADTSGVITRPGDILSRLHLLANVIADELNLCALFAAQETQLERLLAAHAAVAPVAESHVKSPPPSPFAPMSDSAACSLVDFLDKTLITNPRLLHRSDVAYHAVRRWRSTIKQWQLHGVKALKRERSPQLVDLAADEMAAAAVRLYGSGTVEQVASVPCGNSGADCLAQRLAEAVAQRLRIPARRLFADLSVTGASHPRRNATRPRMALREPVTAATLLVDDVATSGAHIAEAATLLRTEAPAVFPLVWLADA